MRQGKQNKTTDVYPERAASLDSIMLAMLTYHGTGGVPRGSGNQGPYDYLNRPWWEQSLGITGRERGAGYWFRREQLVWKNILTAT